MRRHGSIPFLLALAGLGALALSACASSHTNTTSMRDDASVHADAGDDECIAPRQATTFGFVGPVPDGSTATYLESAGRELRFRLDDGTIARWIWDAAPPSRITEQVGATVVLRRASNWHIVEADGWLLAAYSAQGFSRREETILLPRSADVSVTLVERCRYETEYASECVISGAVYDLATADANGEPGTRLDPAANAPVRGCDQSVLRNVGAVALPGCMRRFADGSFVSIEGYFMQAFAYACIGTGGSPTRPTS